MLEDLGELGVDLVVPVALEGKVAEALEELATAVRGALGDNAFFKKLKRRFGRDVKPAKRGRPPLPKT